MRGTAFIGFGEAGQAFARPGVRAYDVKTQADTGRTAKHGDYAAAGVEGCDRVADTLAGAQMVLSVVTADQALAAVQNAAASIEPGTLWLDMNSVAPETKRAAAAVIEAVGARYADVAVMAPVLPGRWSVPLLVSGPHAVAALAMLRDYGFAHAEPAGPRVGDAAGVKMIRSVMVKGIEALSAECILAAERAGVADAVLASLDANWKPQGWGERIDYNLDRMLAHGLRRAAEMEEVARTLEALGVDPAMTRGTIQRQRSIGALQVAPPQGLSAKLAAIETHRKDEAA